MQVEITEKQLMRLRRAADITEIQNLMARLVEAFSRMDVSRVYEDLFAVGDPEVSIELAESGGYDGPEHVQAFLNAYDAYLSYPKDKRGWMELQNICNPTVIRSEDGHMGSVSAQRQVGHAVPLRPGKADGLLGLRQVLCAFYKNRKGLEDPKAAADLVSPQSLRAGMDEAARLCAYAGASRYEA